MFSIEQDFYLKILQNKIIFKKNFVSGLFISFEDVFNRFNLNNRFVSNDTFINFFIILNQIYLIKFMNKINILKTYICQFDYKCLHFSDMFNYLSSLFFKRIKEENGSYYFVQTSGYDYKNFKDKNLSIIYKWFYLFLVPISFVDIEINDIYILKKLFDDNDINNIHEFKYTIIRELKKINFDEKNMRLLYSFYSFILDNKIVDNENDINIIEIHKDYICKLALYNNDNVNDTNL